MTRPRCALAALLSVCVFACAAYFVPGASWSPVSRFCLTRAIVEHRSLEITDFVASTGDRAEVSGRFYTDKGPVPSFAAAPAYAVFYAIAKARHHVPAFRAEGTPLAPAQKVLPSPAFRTGLYVCSLATSGVALALLSWALFDVLSRRVSREAAALGTLTTCLGTPLFPYGTSFFDHTIAAALLVLAFALLDPMAARSARNVFAAGVSLGLAVGTEYVVAVPAVIVGAAALARPRASVAPLILGAAIPLAMLGVYHFACFGSPLRTGYSFITHPGFAAGQASGLFGITWPRPAALFGILFGTSRGLFYVSPVALLGVVQAIRERRFRSDPAFAVAALVFSALLLVNASYYLWDGGRALGPRHLVPALGFVGVGIGYAFERHRSLTAAIAGVSVVFVMLGTAVGLEVPEHIDVLFDYIVPQVRDGHLAHAPGSSNLGLLAGLGARASLLPIAVLVVLAFAAVTRAASVKDLDGA
ncbi:MAG TPA: hypothetical protein VHC69_19180 [Polyangiaceae bacterium]|nr:hypothetical protein [Polyangiaceae bacterium]